MVIALLGFVEGDEPNRLNVVYLGWGGLGEGQGRRWAGGRWKVVERVN